jgi:hypothetical protein
VPHHPPRRVEEHDSGQSRTGERGDAFQRTRSDVRRHQLMGCPREQGYEREVSRPYGAATTLLMLISA